MGRNGPFLGLTLLLLLAGAAYNYHRNAALDRDLESRPYRRLFEEDLSALEQAYGEEIAGLRSRLGRLGGPESFFEEPTHRSDLSARVRAFERSQRTNERWKGLHRKLLEREAEFEAVRHEREMRRAGLDKPWRRVLRRVITF